MHNVAVTARFLRPVEGIVRILQKAFYRIAGGRGIPACPADAQTDMMIGQVDIGTGQIYQAGRDALDFAVHCPRQKNNKFVTAKPSGQPLSAKSLPNYRSDLLKDFVAFLMAV